MTDEIKTPTLKKPSLARFKNLPPWAYIAAIGVGGGAIWYGIHRSTVNATADATDVSGVDPSGGTLSATTAGDAYPSGSQGSGYYPSDPTTGTGSNEFEDFGSLLGVLFPGGIPTGGGTQSSAAPDDHYTPPAITVNVPAAAAPVQTAPSTPSKTADGSKPPDKCVGEYPFLQDQGPRKGKCYKVVTKDKKRYRYYSNGDKVLDA